MLLRINGIIKEALEMMMLGAKLTMKQALMKMIYREEQFLMSKVSLLKTPETIIISVYFLIQILHFDFY